MSLINFLNEKIIVPVADWSMGTEIMKYLAMIKAMSTWSPEQIRDWQNQRLRDLIEHAYNNTEYYRDLFDNNGLIPTDIKDIADLKKIPVLNKNHILKSPEKFIPQNISEIKYQNKATGGSSGDPLKFKFDKKSFSFVTAMRYYHLGRVGYRLGDKLVVLGGISVFPSSKLALKYKLFHVLSRRILLSAVNVSDAVADDHLRVLAQKKIKYIYGFATAIYLLACRAEKRKLKFPWIKACLTTSEMLLDEYRDKIESIFECRVMDVYGAADGGISAYESESHIYKVGYNCIFETENNIGMNNSGNLLTTDLFNYATPFIRYRIGDQISILCPEKAKNYYNGQIITKIWGRNWDVIKLENGNILTGIGFATFVFAGLNIRAYRIKKVGNMHIECELQKTELFSEEEENLIITEFKKQAGQECKVTVSYLEKFEPLPSGKKNYFIANFN